MAPVRRFRMLVLGAIFIISFLYYLNKPGGLIDYYNLTSPQTPFTPDDVHWVKKPEQHTVSSLIPLPTGSPKDIPKVQAKAPVESSKQKEERLRRKAAVLESFTHSWDGYKKYAWLRDEVAPLGGGYRDTFGGWAATLVDSLDSLWIMGLKKDFELAVKAVDQIDFSTTQEKDINVFETTIRYLGGFLAAYDISDAKYPILLKKAVEVGELLMGCFDTPNRMPITRWDWKEYMKGKVQRPGRTLVSELGSLSLEFTRLAQLTGEVKYYDAIQRISDEFEKSQNSTQFPGMWPVSVDPVVPSFNQDNYFTLGGMSDSLYEYLPKQYLILGGLIEQPKKMYEGFIEVAKKHMFFRIYNPKNEHLTVSGDIRKSGVDPDNPEYHLQPNGQHLTCFAGGMVGLASRIFNRPSEIALATELVNGCVWAYDSNPNGISPELFTVMPCPKDGKCKWDDEVWYNALSNSAPPFDGPNDTPSDRAERLKKYAAEERLPPGFTSIPDRRYILRPEAIESVFIMYRITGEQKWQDTAWRMFEAVERVSRTEIAAAAIVDITAPKEVVKQQQMDSMESFWLAETLKYFFLCFEGWEVVSLDEFVLNTEAHPLRRPGA
ncbi:hypothetical protein HYFRA_00007044 [Hymenoscyphus fraxineus]|uniref:alpha-1,2-Mannosidase n=1 Tax=Hymenoscyphus fraxineus TaxID=746836 RepID=A0A9N9KVF4_9HELO|nr:hypothetical protein HYFRA_00007044 [Hymenoscyphus fraxineus]